MRITQVFFFDVPYFHLGLSIWIWLLIYPDLDSQASCVRIDQYLLPAPGFLSHSLFKHTPPLHLLFWHFHQPFPRHSAPSTRFLATQFIFSIHLSSNAAFWKISVCERFCSPVSIFIVSCALKKFSSLFFYQVLCFTVLIFGLLAALRLLWVDSEASLMSSFLVGFVYLDCSLLVVFKSIYIIWELGSMCISPEKM